MVSKLVKFYNIWSNNGNTMTNIWILGYFWKINTENRKNRQLSAVKINDDKMSSKICYQFIRNILRANNIHGRVARKKERLVLKHKSKTCEFWKTVIFSDESKLNFWGKVWWSLLLLDFKYFFWSIILFYSLYVSLTNGLVSCHTSISFIHFKNLTCVQNIAAT